MSYNIRTEVRCIVLLARAVRSDRCDLGSGMATHRGEEEADDAAWHPTPSDATKHRQALHVLENDSASHGSGYKVVREDRSGAKAS